MTASLADLDLLMAIMDESFDPRFGEAWSRAQIAAAMISELNFVRMVVQHGDRIGFTLCRAAGPEIELLLIAVRPGARGSGVGALLVETAIADAHARRASDVFLEVRENNAAALNLYRRGGFAEVGRRSAYYTGPNGLRYDAITMRRAVD